MVAHVDSDVGPPVKDAGALRVLIVPDGTAWFAHGLEVDYAAQGDSVDQTIAYFEEGLRETIALRVSSQNELVRGVGAPVSADVPRRWQWTWLAHDVSKKDVWTEFFKRLANGELRCTVRMLVVDGLPFDAVWYFCASRSRT